MTNGSALGWVSDRSGYRYVACDPETGQPWPPPPARLLQLAHDAAAQAGFADFVPEACPIHRYLPDARIVAAPEPGRAGSATAPVGSVSPRPAGGVSVGGEVGRPNSVASRWPTATCGCGAVPTGCAYHGVLPLQAGQHPLLGEQRINLDVSPGGVRRTRGTEPGPSGSRPSRAGNLRSPARWARSRCPRQPPAPTGGGWTPKQAGIDKKISLGTSCAIPTPPTCSNAGAELVDIKALLGHESISTTQIFTRTSARSGWSRWWGGCDALMGERQCLTSG